MRKRRTRRSTAAAERYLPLVYFGAIVLIAGILLPSALRPPNQQPNQTAQLSPDAPPDKNPDALISSLNRASSGTAGTGNTGAAVGAGGLASPGGPTPPTTFAPRACPKGVGNPPRQVESIYAAPCATPWSGNNGGATWKGVNATEIRVGIRGPGYKCGASYDACHNGPVDQMDPSNMNGAERTFFVLERYFNQSFQLFGRQLRFYFIEPNSLSIQDEQNEAVDADNTYHIFGSPTASSVSCEEWARRQILSYCEELPEKFFNDHRPYTWGGYMSGTEITRFAVEYICKKLAGKPATFAGDPTMHDKVRKIGVVTYNDRGYGADAEWGKAELKRQCGLDEELIFMNPDEANGQAALATAATKLKADGITTVIPGMDWLTASGLDNAAASQQYYPEWYVCDCGALTRNQLGQLQNQTEWAHAFGLSGLEVERPNNSTECYRAYHSIDPANNPEYVDCTYQWRNLISFVSGVQAAGATLTPTSFEKGQFSIGMRYYDHPDWAIGGGFAPGVYTYPHNVTEVWWDATAQDPQNNNGPGAYRYIHGGKRYCLGQINDQMLMFDKSEQSDAVIMSSDSNSAGTSQPRSTCAAR